MMRFDAVFMLVLVAGSILPISAQPYTGNSASPTTGTGYLALHQEADPRFITAVERTGACALTGLPLTTNQLRVPYQLYPHESAEKHEEGLVKMQLIFDASWCVRKATIVESTKFWRLDQASLQWTMTIKWKPAKTFFTTDGEPTVTIPIARGAQAKLVLIT